MYDLNILKYGNTTENTTWNLNQDSPNSVSEKCKAKNEQLRAVGIADS